MATELNVYGESAGSAAGAIVTGCAVTVAAGQQIKITKLQAMSAGAGYVYLRLATVNRYAFYFWATGQQSENNLTMLLPAASVVDMFVVQAGGPFATRCAITGVTELIPI